MAKVGTEQYSFGGRNKHFVHEIPVYYLKQTGFYALVPQAVIDRKPGIQKQTGKTYEEAVNAVRKYCDDFYGAEIKQKKVIVYYIGYKVPEKHLPSINKQYPNKEGLVSHNVDSSATSYEAEKVFLQLKLHYRIKWLCVIGGQEYICDKQISALSEMHKADRWHWNPGYGYSYAEWMNWEYIDHTPEREEFFKLITEKLASLIGSLVDFFGTNVETLVKNITSDEIKILKLRD